MRVLIASEEKTLTESIELLLRAKGVDTEVVFDGEVGEEYAELGIYDLMILDARVSGKSAMEITRSLRNKHCTLPIILLSPVLGLEERVKALKCGVDYAILL